MIVNAANPYLAGGGGVGGAIRFAGGLKILQECQTLMAAIGVYTTGSAVATSAGNLTASWVLHTVGAIWADSDQSLDDDTLASCYFRSLGLAAQPNAGPIAFPNIRTAVFTLLAQSLRKENRSSHDEVAVVPSDILETLDSIEGNVTRMDGWQQNHQRLHDSA